MFLVNKKCGTIVKFHYHSNLRLKDNPIDCQNWFEYSNLLF